MLRLLLLSLVLFPLMVSAESIKLPSDKKVTLESCPKGKVGRFENEVFSCVPGDPQKIAEKMQKKLQKEGLTYKEYIEGLKDMQTTRLGAQVMQYRWEEVTGKRKTKEQIVKEIIDNTVCPESYKANAEGGCEPEVPCTEYGCPEGQVSTLLTDGVNKYCQCLPSKAR